MSKMPLKTETTTPSWHDLAPGDVVIAQDSIAWFEAVVTERRDDMLSLRWRDFPFPPFTRPITAVALVKKDPH